VKEARKAGRDLKEAGFHFDESHTSMLDRAHKTNSLVLEEMDLLDHTEIKKSWRINERHYGSLQGLCKKETAKIYGDD
jgi:2,3-bisphosphoglycerate-dependent phosphoglycerate mutase